LRQGGQNMRGGEVAASMKGVVESAGAHLSF
jgi:hypothetical protein